MEKISKILAPIIPFATEKIFRDLDNNESVHLKDWPKSDKTFNKESEELIEKMQKVRDIVSLGLRERDRSQIGLKWPLNKAVIKTSQTIKEKELLEIIKQQLNVKDLELNKSEEFCVELDTTLTSELENEGFMREISRNVQAFRKKMGLKKDNKISLKIGCEKELEEKLKENLNELKTRTNSENIEFVEDKNHFKEKKEFKIKSFNGSISIKLLN